MDVTKTVKKYSRIAEEMAAKFALEREHFSLTLKLVKSNIEKRGMRIL